MILTAAELRKRRYIKNYKIKLKPTSLCFYLRLSSTKMNEHLQ